MRELNPDQQRALTDAFQYLRDRELRFVVLRRHERLPKVILGDPEKMLDIDVLVDVHEIDRVVACAEAAGFQLESTVLWTWGTMTRKALRKPTKAAKMLVTRPGEVAERVAVPIKRKILLSRINQVGGEGPTGKRHQQNRRDDDQRRYLSRLARQGGGHALGVSVPGLNLKLDIKTHITHVSPLNGSRIQVDPSVVEWMLARRVDAGTHFHPSPPDELAHLVAHCVFEYEGEFPPYYEDRIDGLVEEVFQGGEDEEHLRRVLDTIFFRAGGMVAERVREGRYDRIRTDLFRFSDY